jgi:DNA-binding NarL/FixJ family response regulator
MIETGDRAVTTLRVVCIVDEAASASLLPETVAATLAGAEVTTSDTAVERGVPAADCVVIDVTVNAVPGVEVLRGLRARGFHGGAVLVADDDAEALAASAAALGAVRVVARRAMVTDLPHAVVDALRASGLDGQADTAVGELRRAQQLMAAGEVAMRLQHSLNNPLAALLAEAQLLEMESLSPEHAMSVRRIVEQCRRVIDVVRQLEGIGAKD